MRSPTLKPFEDRNDGHVDQAYLKLIPFVSKCGHEISKIFMVLIFTLIVDEYHHRYLWRRWYQVKHKSLAVIKVLLHGFSTLWTEITHFLQNNLGGVGISLLVPCLQLVPGLLRNFWSE